MDLELRDEVAVVTGAAGGIGLAIARCFLEEGARVALVDREPRTPAIARGMDAAGDGRVAGVVCDISNLRDVEAARDEVLEKLGGFHHVVAAAAIGSGKFGYPFLNLSPADWEPVLRVNILGSVHIAHAFTPHLIEHAYGTLLFISSVAAQFGSQTDPPYSASKAAGLNFAQCVARDLAPHGIRVNSICPGMVKTALNRSVWAAWNERQPDGRKRSYEEWAGEKVESVVPLGRWQEPEDIAGAAVFLASRRAANITGQTLNVDGGYVMR